MATKEQINAAYEVVRQRARELQAAEAEVHTDDLNSDN